MHVLETALIASLQARALGRVEARLPCRECECAKAPEALPDRRHSKWNALLVRFSSLIF